MTAKFLHSWMPLSLMPLIGLTLCPLPVNAVSPLPPTPKERQALTQLLRNAKQHQVCTDSLDMTAAQRASRAYQVNEQTYFVMVQCFLAAYQSNYEFFLYSPNAKSNGVKPLTVSEFTQNSAGKPEKVESPSIGGFPTFDPKQRILTIQSKYRGLGDCGATGRYRLENNTLKLLNFKAKFACDGKMTPYTQIFPSK